MAEVSVEFGATDVGLEQTLKKLQDEMSSLEQKIKSGELSTKELFDTMKQYKDLEKLSNSIKGIGDTSLEARPKIDDLSSEVKKAGVNAKETGEKAEIGFGKIGIAAGIAGAAAKIGMAAVELAMDAARKVVDSFSDALDMGGRLKDLSQRTGEAAGTLLILEKAFTNTGAGADALGPAIGRMQKFLQNGTEDGKRASEVLEKLGLTMEDLSGKTPSEQLKILGDAMGGLSSDTEKTTIAMDVFGRGGAALIPFLTNFSEEFDDAKKKVGGLAEVMSKNSDLFDNVGEKFSKLAGFALEFAAGILDKAAPALNSFLSLLSGVDVVGWGQKLTQVVLDLSDLLIGAFKSPLSVIDAIGLALEANVKQTGNFLLNSFITATDFFGKFFSSEIPSLISDYLGNSMSKAYVDSWRFWINTAKDSVSAFESTFGFSIEGVMRFFSDSFSKMFKFAASDFSLMLTNPVAYFTKEFATSLGKASTEGAYTFGKEYQSASGSVLDKLSAGLDATSREYGDNLEQGTGRIQGGFDRLVNNISISTKDFFGAEPATQRMNLKFDEIRASGQKTRESFEKVGQEMDNAQASVFKIPTHLNRASLHAADIKTHMSDAERSSLGTLGNYQLVEKTTYNAKANMAEAERKMSWDDYKKGLHDANQKLKDFGGEYEKIGRMSLRDMAEALGIHTAEKSSKRLLLEIQQELEKIGKQETIIKIGFDYNKFYNDIDALKSQRNKIFDEPIKMEFQEPDFSAIRQSAESGFKEPISMKFDADNSIRDITESAKTNFSEPFKLSFTGDEFVQEIVKSVQDTFDSTPIEPKINIDQIGETIEEELGNMDLEVDVTPKINEQEIENQLQELQLQTENTFNGGDANAQGGDGGEGGSGGSGGEGGNFNSNSMVDMTTALNLIMNGVDEIKRTVYQIEPKLPVAALV